MVAVSHTSIEQQQKHYEMSPHQKKRTSHAGFVSGAEAYANAMLLCALIWELCLSFAD